MRLTNKVAVVTGAGSGMGRASSLLFAREGARLVVADVDAKGGAETAAMIEKAGGQAIFVLTDVSKASDDQNLINAAKNKFGKIDIILNAAGIPQQTVTIEQLEEATWDRIYAVNVKSIFLTSKYAFPVMKANGGSIINIASISGVRPRPGNHAYASSKAAVIMLTKILALEFAPSKIRVNCINPVATDTPMLNKFFPAGVKPEDARKGTLGTIPLGRLATADDVANAALFLASDESSLITGSAIDVDGGRGI